MTIFYLMELPIPRYDKNNKLHKNILTNTAKLICTTSEYSKLRNQNWNTGIIVDSENELCWKLRLMLCLQKFMI